MYSCGCTVSRQGTDVASAVTGVGVCAAHRATVERDLEVLADYVSAFGRLSGEAVTLDPKKMSATLEKALRMEAAEGGPVDGPA